MTREQILAQDLRRILYFQELLKDSLEAVLTSSILPKHCKLRTNTLNQLNSIRVYRADILTIAANKTLVQDELSSDRIKDLNLIFEKINSIENIGEVYDWICDMTDTAEKSSSLMI